MCIPSVGVRLRVAAVFMQIWPAIDLRGGRCVRLEQGDYDRETVFRENPADAARQWISEGADRLHLVDLDGARDGTLANLEAIRQIVAAVDVPCQLGGGIRSESTITQLMNLGLERLVVGTRALREPEWFQTMCRRYPHQLVLGIDAREGQVATDGWLETSSVSATTFARKFNGEPIAAIVYTDIARDGMLAGPNLEAMRQMQQAVELTVIASGGVTTVDDVVQLAAIPMDGAIIGRALYQGNLTITQAMDAAQHPAEGKKTT